MPQDVESNRRDYASSRARFPHRTYLLGAFPPATVVASKQQITRRSSGAKAIHEVRCLAGQRDMAHAPALGLSDRERLDVWILVGNLEPGELAVAAAREQGRVDEVPEGALTTIEQARDLPLRQITDNGSIDGLEGFHAAPGLV
jgi:hypothetical protein